MSVRNDYVTPRGLVVTTSGAAVQVLNGLVAVSQGGVAFHGGTWVDLNPGYSKADGNNTAVNALDFFFGLSANVKLQLKVVIEYRQFITETGNTLRSVRGCKDVRIGEFSGHLVQKTLTKKTQLTMNK